MKILFISMPSIHAVRWIENLEESGHNLYWFDVLGKGKLSTEISIQQITSWKKRKIPYIKGEYWVSKKFPKMYNRILPYLETTVNEGFEKIVSEINPDVIHSFELHYSSFPILDVLNQHFNIKWIYSCWGSDFYNHLENKQDILKIEKVLKRVNYLITDCQRDYSLAKKFNFKGEFLGVFPGGGGYNLNKLKSFKTELEERNIILIKGYENLIGKAINVLKAIKLLEKELDSYEIYIFSYRAKTIKFINDDKYLKNKINLVDETSHLEILKIMGRTKIYISNNKSDGMPNTLLEAIIMGAFPIQTNPGNVTSEIIENYINGLLIENCEDVEEIKNTLFLALSNSINFKKAVKINEQISVDKLDYDRVNQRIIKVYNKVIDG